jgi:hypothetical protein
LDSVGLGIFHVPELRLRSQLAKLFQDKYPYAGGPNHYAAYLFNSDGFEVELVAAG